MSTRVCLACATLVALEWATCPACGEASFGEAPEERKPDGWCERCQRVAPELGLPCSLECYIGAGYSADTYERFLVVRRAERAAVAGGANVEEAVAKALADFDAAHAPAPPVEPPPPPEGAQLVAGEPLAVDGEHGGLVVPTTTIVIDPATAIKVDAPASSAAQDDAPAISTHEVAPSDAAAIADTLPPTDVAPSAPAPEASSPAPADTSSTPVDAGGENTTKNAAPRSRRSNGSK